MRKIRTTVNIMEDEELKELIEKLVDKSMKKGVRITYLKDVIYEEWKSKEISSSIERKKLTQIQKDYIQKVETFVKEYGDDFINYYNSEVIEWRDFINSRIEGEERTKEVKKELKEILITLFLVFDNKEDITQFSAKKYMKYVNPSVTWKFDNYYMRLLKNFFTNHLKFEGNGKPKYVEGWVEKENRIINQKSFQEWDFLYKYKKSNAYRVAMASIWLINKYYKSSKDSK